jgi:hypothetical protein
MTDNIIDVDLAAAFFDTWKRSGGTAEELRTLAMRGGPYRADYSWLMENVIALARGLERTSEVDLTID